MKKWYKVSINGHIEFPGEDLLLEAPTESAFDWRSWEYDVDGVEFDLPVELFEKPYQTDDFEVEITAASGPIMNEMITKGKTVTFSISAADESTLQSYWDDPDVITPYLWLKHVKLEMDLRPSGQILTVVLASEAPGSLYEYDTIQAYYDSASNDQKYTVSRYAKTYVGAKVRVFEVDSTHSSGYRIKYAGRISEEPVLLQRGMFHFVSKDEVDWLDVKTPDYNPNLIGYRYGIQSYINPRYSILTGFSKTENSLWSGEIAELTNADLTFTSPQKFDTSYFANAAPDTGRFDTFKEGWDAYLKLSRQQLQLSQTTLGVIQTPKWDLVDLDTTPTSSGAINLISLLGVEEFMDVQLAPASSAAELNYLGARYVTKTTKKTIRGELDTFTVDLPDDFTVRYSGGSPTFDAVTWGVEYAEFFDSIYQVIRIPSETTLLPDDIQPGNYYTIDSDSLEMISVFIDSSISDWVFCVSRSDDEFVFWHVKDPT
jgi:hypothetical protein